LDRAGREERASATTKEITMTNESTIKSSRSRRWGLLLALPLAGALSVPAVSAFAGPGWGHRGMGGEMGEFAGRRMAKVLDAAGATDAQKAQIKATWDGLRPQLKAVREEGMKVRQELRQALTAPTVDAGKVEQLRKQTIQLADRASTLATQGMVSSAQVLTPEQRQKIAAELEKHQGHHPGE
jgi:Spy/CpxP family protein refolding chaperone